MPNFKPDADLVEMTLEELQTTDKDEVQLWQREAGTTPDQSINAPGFDTQSIAMGIMHALAEAGLIPYEEMHKAALRFKITQARMIRKQIIPQIKKQQARAAILEHGPILPPGIRQ